MQNNTYACFRCRIAWKAGPNVCTRCGVAATLMGRNWRAPKRNDVASWKRVEAGDYFWERPKNYFNPVNIFSKEWRAWRLFQNRIENPKYGRSNLRD